MMSQFFLNLVPMPVFFQAIGSENISAANTLADQFLGISLTGLPLQTLNSLFSTHGGDMPYQRVLVGGKVETAELRVLTERGEVPILMRSRKSSEGTMTSFVEVTELMTRENALRQSVQMQDDFLQIACHELKSPLTPLMLQSQLVRRILKVGSDPSLFYGNLLKIAGEVENQVLRLNRLIDDTLDSMRLKSGKLSIKKTSVDITQLVRQVLERFASQLDQVHCAARLNCEQSIIGQWDQDRIEQVFINLLSNAMKYGAGASIEISLYRDKNCNVLLSVTDHGVGIPAADQARIFEMFARGAATQGISGLGLGLYIARQIVEAHDGKISLESTVGKGTTFFVELPIHCDATLPA